MKIKSKKSILNVIGLLTTNILLITIITLITLFPSLPSFAQSSGQCTISGDTPSGSADLGNPVKIGGIFNTTAPTLTTGQRGDAQLTNRSILKIALVDVAGGTQLDLNGFSVDAISSGVAGILTENGNLEFNGTTFDRVRHSFTQATTGITTNAAGISVDMTTTPMSKFSMFVIRTTGATDVVSINLEGSYDGTNWFTAGSIITVTGGSNKVHVVDQPYRFIRYNVVTVGAGNTLTIQLLAVGR